MNVLVVGAGIAGPTLAYWLRRGGHVPTLVEHAPALRRGGYVVDFWGTGFDVAERMGIVPALTRAGYRLAEVRQVDDDGARITSLDPAALVRSTGERYISIARGDLAAIVYDALEDEVETIFADSIRAIVDDGDRVHVELDSGTTRDFDLVVGADGLHSRVRRLVFGPDDEVETFQGISVAAFDVRGYRPRDELAAVMHTQVGYQVARLAMRDDVTMFLFTFRDDGTTPDDVAAQQSVLRAKLAGARWEVPAILECMADARTFYFDRVSQIRMPAWTRGRVALVGDAAASPSLLAGQGSALAMVEAYVLAAELTRSHGDHVAAFAGYEQSLAKFVRSKQEAAAGLGAAFAPRSCFQLWLRNTVMKLMGIPWIAELAMGRSLRDSFVLPDFPARDTPHAASPLPQAPG